MTKIFMISGLLFLGTVSLVNAKCPYSTCQANKLDAQLAKEVQPTTIPADISKSAW